MFCKSTTYTPDSHTTVLIGVCLIISGGYLSPKFGEKLNNDNQMMNFLHWVEQL